MDITDALLEKIAHLARLDFPDAEKASIKADLQRMVHFVEKLEELDTTGVQPLLHMSDVVDNLREDEVKGSMSTEEALRNAPGHNGRFFLVPKVIKK
jgi:aspartyl-tRNA(Asn)/glutamyl-tRNA(Gln) amidotransferase subunit C